MKQTVQKQVQKIQNQHQNSRPTATTAQKPPATSTTHRPSSQHSKKSTKSSKSVEYWSVQYANDRTGAITTNQFTVDPRGSKGDQNPTIKHRKSAAEKELCKRLVSALKELKDVASRAVILNDFDEDALDDEEYLILFIQELESCLKETITLESRQKQLIQQSRNGGTGGNMLNKEGYSALIIIRKRNLYSNKLFCLIYSDFFSYFTSQFSKLTNGFSLLPIPPTV